MKEDKFFKWVKNTLFTLGFLGFILALLILFAMFSDGPITDNGRTNAEILQALFLFFIACILLMGFFKDDMGNPQK